MTPKLHIVTASTRPGRVGPIFAKWFHDFAVRYDGFESKLVDLADFNLPLLDEADHPMRRNYRNDHTKDWSASVGAADAFVFVTPEYNYGPPPALVNALDYLYFEWNYKPAGFVSYGGVSGGLRSVQLLKQMLSTLKLVPIPEGVAIPNFFQHIENGVFTSNELIDASAKTMLDELVRWTGALKSLRG